MAAAAAGIEAPRACPGGPLRPDTGADRARRRRTGGAARSNRDDGHRPSAEARTRDDSARRYLGAGRCAALTRSAARLGSRTLGMQCPGRRRIDTGMAVLPVDAVARRRVLAQNFSDGPGACAALCRLGLRDDAISDLEGHSLLPSIAAGSGYELKAGAGKCV